jgi:hypothetical protein
MAVGIEALFTTALGLQAILPHFSPAMPTGW